MMEDHIEPTGSLGDLQKENNGILITNGQSGPEENFATALMRTVMEKVHYLRAQQTLKDKLKKSLDLAKFSATTQERLQRMRDRNNAGQMAFIDGPEYIEQTLTIEEETDKYRTHVRGVVLPSTMQT